MALKILCFEHFCSFLIQKVIINLEELFDFILMAYKSIKNMSSLSHISVLKLYQVLLYLLGYFCHANIIMTFVIRRTKSAVKIIGYLAEELDRAVSVLLAHLVCFGLDPKGLVSFLKLVFRKSGLLNLEGLYHTWLRLLQAIEVRRNLRSENTSLVRNWVILRIKHKATFLDTLVLSWSLRRRCFRRRTLIFRRASILVEAHSHHCFSVEIMHGSSFLHT